MMFKTILNIINPNLFWIAIIAFFLGIYFGGTGAWWWQELNIHALKNKYENFVNDVKANGEIAKKRSEQKKMEDKERQEKADDEYQINIASLRADIKRMHHARSGSSYLPPASSTSKNTLIACFDRPQLERAIQQLDDEIQKIVTTGDEAVISLNNARRWAKEDYQTSAVHAVE